MNITLTTPLAQLPTVSKTLAKKLRGLGLITAQDLIFHFPTRYEDYRRSVALNHVKPNEPVTVRGRLQLLANRRSFHQRRMLTEAVLADNAGLIKIVWFNQPYIAKTLKVGDRLAVAGRATLDRFGLQFINPIFEKDTGAEITINRLLPVYPTTAGVSQKHLRYLLKLTRPLFNTLADWLPEKILTANNLPDLATAMHRAHFPTDEKQLRNASERFQFEELFILQLRNELSRVKRTQTRAPAIGFKEAAIKKIVAGLPFQLTASQRRSAWEILQNLTLPQPMNRLLSGDVGSGKTVVAALAMYNTALNGYQAALMAPTEILAQQHWQSLQKTLGGNVPIGLLTNSKQSLPGEIDPEISTAEARRRLLEKIKKGELPLVVGTHALLSEKVKFKKLGLVVVDEQHRFGVAQRQAIKEKGRQTHFLSMTATPIPRSLALTIFGDLDLSTIDELPPQRKTIITRLVETFNRARAYQFLRQQIKYGRQVFVVCPLIEEAAPEENGGAFKIQSEKKSVLTEYQKLQEQIFPDLAVSFLHGKMPTEDKDKVMEDFRANRLNILVSTSVVEVGVDIPNASVMMIEGADRFGLAQLHQFRGRVGRAEHQSYCLLFTDSTSSKAKERLNFFEKENNGFKLAEKDLTMRGPGDVFGTEQSGLAELRLAKLDNPDLIRRSREAARQIAPQLAHFPLITEQIKKRVTNYHWE